MHCFRNGLQRCLEDPEWRNPMGRKFFATFSPISPSESGLTIIIFGRRIWGFEEMAQLSCKTHPPAIHCNRLPPVEWETSPPLLSSSSSPLPCLSLELACKSPSLSETIANYIIAQSLPNLPSCDPVCCPELPRFAREWRARTGEGRLALVFTVDKVCSTTTV